ncbi:hypothetical protein CDAR_166211 [Caerostris darwini]|uniref:Uncharacterized protein n=1 Tax=Caerostris darwini TaxID=1538125 RepID=A0AAV4RTB7_9ARAC|nr:hypothetical protein CDAR_166211 [Caerostris darwini]
MTSTEAQTWGEGTRAKAGGGRVGDRNRKEEKKFGSWAKRACNCSSDSLSNSKVIRDARDSDPSNAMRQARQEAKQEERGKRWKFK